MRNSIASFRKISIPQRAELINRNSSYFQLSKIKTILCEVPLTAFPRLFEASWRTKGRSPSLVKYFIFTANCLELLANLPTEIFVSPGGSKYRVSTVP